MPSYNWPPQGSGSGGSGVSSLNALTGALTLVQGTGITITPSGSNITIAATGAGSGTVTSVGMTVPTFLSVTPASITTSGTFALTLSGTALPIANGGTGQTSNITAPAATTIPSWDANKNLSANAFIFGYATTATAATTTTLTVSSAETQIFTGTTTQTVLLPVTSTLVLGQKFQVYNNSTGVVTVQSSGANTIQAMAANTIVEVTCILTSGTTAASWNAVYYAKGTVPVALGGTGQTSVIVSPTASTYAGWDANKNLSANATIDGFTTTATAAGTTTMTVTSTKTQYFTGTTIQTVKLPTTSIVAGQQYTITNQSTGVVTVQSSGANTIVTLSQNTSAVFTALIATPTTAANWDFEFLDNVSSSTAGFVYTSTGTTSAPTWQSSGSSPTNAYAQAFFGAGSQWTTSSTTFVDPTNTGGNTLTVRQHAGITLTAAASTICGITFTPASSTAVYQIWAQVAVLNNTAANYAQLQMTDGTTTISSPGLIAQPGGNTATLVTLGGIYVPGTASAVTVKLQALASSGATVTSISGQSVTGSNTVEWTIMRIV